MVAAGHRLLEPRQLLLGRDHVAGAREGVLAQRQPELERRPLVVQRDARALLERELAAVDLGLPGEHAEQRRLAGAVRPGEREPLAALDLEADAVEEQVPGELLLQVVGNDDGHATSVGTGASVDASSYAAGVSIDLAVWQGARPASDKEALKMYESLYELYIESDEPRRRSPAIAAYVGALLERYPDRTDDQPAIARGPTAR